MAKASHGVLVRRFEAIGNLGGMDVLCTDKTGTLTTLSIALSGAVETAGQILIYCALVRQLLLLVVTYALVTEFAEQRHHANEGQ